MKIGLLDHMGYGNLGDAATQEALIAHIKRRVPDAVIVGFSLNPEDTRKRHNITSYSITHWHPGLNKSSLTSTDRRTAGVSLKLIFKKIPVFSTVALWVRNLVREVVHLGRSFKILRSLDTLIIAGGGQLCELWRGPWSHPYNIFKFSVLAKAANKQLIVLNVGAGPLNSFLGRMFVKCSVCLADYVSFRDVESQALIQRLGVNRPTHVFPDSVYALDMSDYEVRAHVRDSRPLVGLNPIGFCDPRVWPRKDADAYLRYLDNLAAFSVWLLNHNYRLKIFSGEASVDTYALADLRERIRNSVSPADLDEICGLPSESVKDLLGEMSSFDFVVTSKFHGVIFSHLLQKPVVALSYHKKIDDLMGAVGHGRYCLSIESFNEKSMDEAFTALVQDVQGVKSRFRLTTRSYADALKVQFDELFVPGNLRISCRELGEERQNAILGGSA
jgi:polysaccharide pyruvyl transferase WcaK-like protein